MRALRHWIWLAMPAALALSACGDGPTGPGTSSTLRVRGRVTAVTSAATSAVGDATGRTTTGRSAAVSVADVRKVLVYRDFGVADVVNIDADGRFAVDVAREACGLVFLDAADHTIGYLTLANGIAALPLMMVDSSVRVVDLDSIEIADSVAVPSNDPTAPGGVAAMTPTEVAAYRLQSALFATIIRNLDMNDDGVIDVLSPRPYMIWLRSWFNGGTPPTTDPGPAAPAPAIADFSFFFSDFALASSTSPATLRLPGGQTYLSGLWQYDDPTPGRSPYTIHHWVLQNTGWQAFGTGSYRIDYEGRPPVSFDLRFPLDGNKYIVATRVWYEVTADTIRRIHWEWRMRDGSNIDPTRLMRPGQVMIQFGYGIGTEGGTSIDVRVRPDETSRDVKAPLSGLSNINFGADDLFGNQLITVFRFGVP